MSKEQFKSEILFLLIGNNPLPNYVAAKLLAKPFSDGKKPVVCLIHSDGTKDYAKYLSDVLGVEYDCKKLLVDPWQYSSVKGKVKDYISKIKEHAKEVNYKVSVGLNYTGGTKAMSVHAYRAIESLKDDSFDTYFSYLDSVKKWMRIDIEDGGQEVKFDLSDASETYFEQTKISLDELLRLHGWEEKEVPLSEPQFSDTELDAANLPNFTDKEFESYILKAVIDLKGKCSLESIYANVMIKNPDVSKNEKYCEIDVVAIRGYQLFAISCTIAKIDDHIIKVRKCPHCGKDLNKKLIDKLKDEANHILTHKLFEVAHRAKQLGGAEARIGLACMANAERTKNLRDKLRDDKIAVFGAEDLPGLRTQLKRWFNQ